MTDNSRPTSTLSRRDFLAGASAAAVSCVTGSRLVARADSTPDPYGGFRMGVQSYSLRGFDTKTALEHTRRLGLRYWEAYPRHLPMSGVPRQIQQHKQLLKKAGITLLAYGVLPFDANETKARQAFDFAHAMGLVAISANPKKEKKTFDLLDRLVEEYDIAIAIHNHGPGALYDKIADVDTWVKDRHPKIGACVDTGHYIRSDEDPVEAIERLGRRVFGVHLKDVRTIRDPEEVARLKKADQGRKRKRLRDGDRKLMTVLGQGDLDIVGCLKALRRLNYDYCLSLEYEENPDNPLSDIEVCLSAVRRAVARLDS